MRRKGNRTWYKQVLITKKLCYSDSYRWWELNSCSSYTRLTHDSPSERVWLGVSLEIIPIFTTKLKCQSVISISECQISDTDNWGKTKSLSKKIWKEHWRNNNFEETITWNIGVMPVPPASIPNALTLPGWYLNLP